MFYVGMGKTFLAIKLSEFLVLRDKGGEGGGGVGGDGGVGGGEGGKETETKFQPSRKVYALKTNDPIGASWRFTSRPFTYIHNFQTLTYIHTYIRKSWRRTSEQSNLWKLLCAKKRH